MKLKKGFIRYARKGEFMLVPTAEANFKGLVQGNKTLGAILELLKEDTTQGEIISAMKEKYDAPDGTIEQDVNRAVAELRKIGALDE